MERYVPIFLAIMVDTGVSEGNTQGKLQLEHIQLTKYVLYMLCASHMYVCMYRYQYKD